MSATTTTSGKSKTAGKVSPSRSTPHVTPASQHANGAVMSKPNANAHNNKSANPSTQALVQPKLTVGKPNDSYEQQADAMAQKVVSMSPGEVQRVAGAKSLAKEIRPMADKNPSRSPLQKKDQPGSFMLKATEKEKVSKKEDEKIKKKADEKLQKTEELKKKASDEKLQKTEELKKKASDEKLQKTEELKKKASDEKLQKTEELKKKASDEKLQKTEELKKKAADEKLQKTEELKKKASDEKLQKTEELKKKGADEKLQKTEELKKKAEPVQLKEEEKLQKTEELKKKADEKLQKKAEPEKIQKAPEQKVQPKETVQPKPVAVVQTKPVQLKEEEKLRKTEELKKSPDEKIQKKADEKIHKAPGSDIAAKETVQAKPLAVVQAKPVQLKEEEKLRKAEEQKEKPKEFEGAGKVQKKSDAEKIQKSDANSQPVIQKTTAAPIAPLQKKEEEKIQKAGDEKLQKAADEKMQKASDEKLMKMSEDAGEHLSPEFEARLQGTMSSGVKMDRTLRAFMEARFDADFTAVRFHMDTTAIQLCNEVGAQAFAYKNHVYFNRGKYQPDTDSGKFLIAHELTHVIQQGYATQKGGTGNAPAQPAAKAEEKVQKSPQNISSASPRIQRIGWDTVNDAVRRVVPPWTLLTVIMGYNPIIGENVARGPMQWFQALLDIIPVVGPAIFDKLRSSGMLARAEAWLNSVMAQLPSLGEIRATWDRAYAEMGILEGVDGNIAIFRRHFGPIFTRVGHFVGQVLAKVVEILRETLLRPLDNVIKDIPGWDLITTLIGSNPLTGEAKPRTAMNVIRGVVAFIPGGQEKLDQLVQSRALEKAYQWFMEETTARNLTWARISATFTRAWDSLSANDILHPIDTFNRLRGMVSPLLSDLASFALAALIKLLEFIYEAVMGAGGARVLAIVKRTQTTFLTIIRNPVGFLGNLLQAVGMGIRNFGTNILRHLQTGVITWLTGTLARGGVEIPTVWDLGGVLKLIMSILGLTWPRIREIAVRVFGPTVVTVLETAAGLVMDIKEKGFVQAMRDKISEIFGNVKEMILGRIKSFIQTRIVMAGIQWLASMLSPVGAVIQAIIKTYETVMFFIQKINEIMEFVNTVLNAVENIANGALGPAAAYVENAMARTIPLILDFLARLLGLGDIGGMIRGIIQQVQTFIAQKIEQALIGIRGMVQRLIAAGGRAVQRIRQMFRVSKPARLRSGETHTLVMDPAQPGNRLMMHSAPQPFVNWVDRNYGPQPGGIAAHPQHAQMQTLATNIETLQTNYGAATTDAQRITISNNISVAVNQLALVLETVAPPAVASVAPATIYTYGGVNANGFGIRANANFLSRNRVAGQAANVLGPNEYVAGWDIARSRTRVGVNDPTGYAAVINNVRPRILPDYVRGHLMNGRLGGPAFPYNLTPIRGEMNNNGQVSSHFAMIEQPLQDAILNAPAATPRVFNYEVQAIYGTHNPRSTLRSHYNDMFQAASQARTREQRIFNRIPVSNIPLRQQSQAKMDSMREAEIQSLYAGDFIDWEERNTVLRFDCIVMELRPTTTTPSRWEPSSAPGTLNRAESIAHNLPESRTLVVPRSGENMTFLNTIVQ